MLDTAPPLPESPAADSRAVPKPRLPGRDRVWVLDGLRLGAALMVVAYHYMAIGGKWEHGAKSVFPTVSLPSAYGWMGVELFFMISGFVICMSCWGKSLGDFFVSRVIRIYPAYWFAIALTTAVVIAFPGGVMRRNWDEILTNLTMLQGPLNARDVDAVYWTLGSELHFYLMFAVVVWRGVTYRKVVLFALLWAMASATFAKFDDSPVKQFIMPEYSWYFIAGMMFYLMYRFRPNLLLLGIVAACYVVSQRFALNTLEDVRENVGLNVPQWPVPVILAVFFAVFLLIATHRLSWITWGWLPALGALTYPLYLLHEYIGWEIIAKFQGRVNAGVLVGALVAGMLILSWLVNRLIEKPMSGWLRGHMIRSLADLRGMAESARQGR
ncbi:acyltransferase family protein [Uniformispora flossi]|uniref:acyltransferase family protein n=1 Tax=Uniformispora flossi TaxID=3390723 RepID=UPI003C2D333E